MNGLTTIYDYENEHISTDLIFDVVNSSGGILYTTITNEICAYNLFNHINDNNKILFRKNVLEPGNEALRELIAKFFEKLKCSRTSSSNYKTYLDNFINEKTKINKIMSNQKDSEIDNNTNYFKEESERKPKIINLSIKNN